MTSPRDRAVGRLTDAGLLTERQAAAYYHRRVMGVSRERAAEEMGISANVLDKHLSAAVSKIEGARETVETVQALHGYEVDMGADR